LSAVVDIVSEGVVEEPNVALVDPAGREPFTSHGVLEFAPETASELTARYATDPEKLIVIVDDVSCVGAKAYQSSTSAAVFSVVSKYASALRLVHVKLAPVMLDTVGAAALALPMPMARTTRRFAPDVDTETVVDEAYGLVIAPVMFSTARLMCA
jgi:hypothetical protein